MRDALAIGAGPGGLAAAAELGRRGLRATIDDLVGQFDLLDTRGRADGPQDAYRSERPEPDARRIARTIHQAA